MYRLRHYLIDHGPGVFLFICTLLLLALFLGGCGASDAYRGAAAATAAEGADDFLETNVWGVCTAPSIASVRRKYGGSVESATRYAEFCNIDEEGTTVLVGPLDDASGDQ